MESLREMEKREIMGGRLSSGSYGPRRGAKGVWRTVVALIVLSVAGRAAAALSPPNFMPGFPLVAGPQIIFMWSPVIGAEKYRIYQNGKAVAEVAAFQHILPVPAEGKHSYHVVAVDKEGKESPAGKAFEYAVRTLSPPKNVSILIREKKVAVRWDPAEGALVYDVFRGDTPDGQFELIGSTQEVALVDPNVKAGSKYYYRIASKDAMGTSSKQTDPVLAAIEEEVAAPAAKRLSIIKTKLAWEKGNIENASDILYLSDDSLIAVAPFSVMGPHLVIVENLASGDGKRTVIPLPEEHKDNRFGGVGRSADGTVWVTGNLSPKLPTLYRVDPAAKKIVEIVEVEPLPKTATPYSFEDVAEAPNGDLYVTEQKNNAVMVIRKGKIVSRFGEKGRAGGQFAAPGYILIADNVVLVSDAVQATISFFGLDGKYIRRAGALGGRDPGTFSRLTGIAVDKEKKWIFAGDRATSQVQVLDYEGKFVAMLANEEGTAGPNTNPVGLDLRNGALLISWQTAHRVQEFKLLGPPEERK